jgi:predicted phage terminase large subunit-like protein
MASALRDNNPLITFCVKASRGRWTPAPHLRHLSDKLMDVAGGRVRRLMIHMPPRHGKSELTSRFFPAWYLGNHPDRRVILASYEADFASTWGRRARDILEEHGTTLFPAGVKVSAGSSSASRWDIEGHAGGMTTAGAGGPIGGKGADLLLLDDLVKNDQEGNSRLHQEKVWEWYKSTAYPRLEPRGAIVLIMTRWSMGDLAGRLLEERAQGGEPWEVVSLPALAGIEDPIGRQPGEALWPERFPAPALEEIRRAIGSYWWSALYQQQPHLPEGNLFKRDHFRYFEVAGSEYVLHQVEGEKRVPTSSCIVIQTVDPAASMKTAADFFVVATWAISPEKDLLLLDMIRMHVEGPDQPGLIARAYQRWKPQKIGVETVSLGLVLYQQLVRQGLPMVELRPEKDKVTRAIPMAARYESGAVYHPRHAPWLDDLEEELVAFPAGAHDDQVDAVTYAFTLLETVKVITGPRFPIVGFRRRWD